MRRALITGAAGALLLAGSRAALAWPAAQRADVRCGDAIRARGGRRLDRIVVATTDLGSLYAAGGASATLTALGRRQAAAEVAALAAAGWVISQASKTVVRRERPYDAHGVARLIRPPTGTSFPSGHATVATALGAVLSRRARRPLGPGLLSAIGPYVCLTRVYTGVHYPTDVIGGAGLGLLLSAAWQGTVASRGSAATGWAARRIGRLSRPVGRALWRVATGR